MLSFFIKLRTLCFRVVLLILLFAGSAKELGVSTNFFTVGVNTASEMEIPILAIVKIRGKISAVSFGIRGASELGGEIIGGAKIRKVPVTSITELRVSNVGKRGGVGGIGLG